MIYCKECKDFQYHVQSEEMRCDCPESDFYGEEVTEDDGCEDGERE